MDRSLFIQARAVLKKERIQHPRSKLRNAARDNRFVGIESATMKLAFSVVFLLCITPAFCGQRRTLGPGMPARRRSFSVVEATIPDMQAAMKEGRVTSRELVTQFLLRIALYNSKLTHLRH